MRARSDAERDDAGPDDPPAADAVASAAALDAASVEAPWLEAAELRGDETGVAWMGEGVIGGSGWLGTSFSQLPRPRASERARCGSGVVLRLELARAASLDSA